MKSEDEAYHGRNEEEDSNTVDTFDLSQKSKLLAFGRFDMEEEQHRKQCKATDRQVEAEVTPPCLNKISTRR